MYKIVDREFEDVFSELTVPDLRSHNSAVRALDDHNLGCLKASIGR